MTRCFKMLTTCLILAGAATLLPGCAEETSDIDKAAGDAAEKTEAATSKAAEAAEGAAKKAGEAAEGAVEQAGKALEGAGN